VFVRAADSRNFTDAGRQLSLSSSAVGKTIARLEERLGVRLFHRSTRSIALTHEGALFLESCRRILSEVEAVESEFAQNKGAPRGRLRVSLPLLGRFMMPTLSNFIHTYPKIALDLDFTDNLVDVIEGGFDVVVRTGKPADSRLMSRTLGAFRLEVVGSPAYFARAGTPAVPEELVEHSCLHHKYPTMGKIARWPFRRLAAGTDVVLPTAAIVSTIEPLVSLAERGVGIACLPDFAIREQIATGSLVRILDEYIDHKGSFYIAWPSSRHPSPKLRVFVDFLVEHLFSPQRMVRG
jgi:DNA-binding transcriptional LysR family regulator